MTARVYNLTLQTPLPSRDAVLENYVNKVQLNKLLCQEILTDDTFLKAVTDSHVLTVTIHPHTGAQGTKIAAYEPCLNVSRS